MENKEEFHTGFTEGTMPTAKSVNEPNSVYPLPSVIPVISGRVEPGGCPPGTPTDPDVPD